MERNDGCPKVYQKARKTRKKIGAALVEILEHKPLDKITVQELCDQAEIHRSTFYKHFSSIFDVVAYITKEITEALMCQAESAAGGDVYFDFITDFYLRYRKALRNLYRTRYREMMVIKMSEIIERYYHKLLKELKREIEEDVPLEWMAKYHAGGMITVGSILLDEKYDDEECRKKLAAFYRYILIRK